jgi:hypothetical protein
LKPLPPDDELALGPLLPLPPHAASARAATAPTAASDVARRV